MSVEHLLYVAIDENLKHHKLPILLCLLKKLEMKKVLILAILCIASAGCVELENICSDVSFKYYAELVNAIHRVRWNVTFQPLQQYLINDSVKCDQAEFKNKTNYLEALRIKQE